MFPPDSMLGSLVQNSEAEEMEQEKIASGAMDDDARECPDLDRDTYSFEDLLERVQASERELREALETLNAAKVGSTIMQQRSVPLT